MENKKKSFFSIRFPDLCWIAVFFLTGLLCFNQPKPFNQIVKKISYTKQFIKVADNQGAINRFNGIINIDDSMRQQLTESARQLDDIDSSLISGQIKYYLGDYKAALFNFQKFSEVNTKNEVPSLFIYKTALILGEKKIANDMLERGNYQKEQLISYIRLLEFENLHGELMPLLRKISKMDPDNPETWKLWLEAGQIFENKTQYFQALQIYYEALQVQKSHNVNHYPSSFWLNIGRIYQSGLKIKNQELVLNIYEKSERLRSFQNLKDESNLHLYKGWVYRSYNEQQYDDDVLNEFQNALLITPEDYYLLCEIGVFYLYKLQNFNMAKNYFESALTVDKEKPNAYHLLGDTYLFLNSPDTAKIYYQLALSKDKNYSVSKIRLDEIQNNNNE